MRTELRSWRRAWPRVGKATVDVEVEAEVVEEAEDAEEEEKEEDEEEEDEENSSDLTTLTWQVGNIYIYTNINKIIYIYAFTRMVDFTFPLQLKGTCLPQKNCFALDLVYYMLGIA